MGRSPRSTKHVFVIDVFVLAVPEPIRNRDIFAGTPARTNAVSC